jgi:hypothetical protein
MNLRQIEERLRLIEFLAQEERGHSSYQTFVVILWEHAVTVLRFRS